MSVHYSPPSVSFQPVGVHQTVPEMSPAAHRSTSLSYASKCVFLVYVHQLYTFNSPAVYIQFLLLPSVRWHFKTLDHIFVPDCVFVAIAMYFLKWTNSCGCRSTMMCCKDHCLHVRDGLSPQFSLSRGFHCSLWMSAGQLKYPAFCWEFCILNRTRPPHYPEEWGTWYFVFAIGQESVPSPLPHGCSDYHTEWAALISST